MLIIPLLSRAQVPVGIQHFDPIGDEAARFHGMTNSHTVMRPLNPFLERDEVLQTADSVLVQEQEGIRTRVRPIADLGMGASLLPEAGFALNGYGGAQAEAFVGDRWFFRAGYLAAGINRPQHLMHLDQRVGTLQGFGRSTPLGNARFAHMLTGTAGMRIGKHFSIEAGREKHFWGDGYRSPVLSHNAAPMPYARLTTRVWNIKWVNLWTMMDDFNLETSERRFKFMAIHGLSWDITPKFNLQLYEAVVWQAEDRLVNRGFDYTYLNPFIFYRPIEFAKGSADNMLLGFAMRRSLGKKGQLYGNVYFDEFMISELRSRSEWWGNKYAIQLGFKGFNIFTEGHHLLSELNLARPFMYTHGSVLQAYSHTNLPLAHPHGANFVEWITRSRLVRGETQILTTLSLAAYALDPEGENFGNDVLTSYRNPARRYGNHILQGERRNIVFLETEIARPLGVGDFLGFVQAGARHNQMRESNSTDFWIFVGLRSPLVRPYRDF